MVGKKNKANKVFITLLNSGISINLTYFCDKKASLIKQVIEKYYPANKTRSKDDVDIEKLAAAI